MSRMLKTQIPRAGIVWMAPAINRVNRNRINGEAWYVLRIYEPYARSSGARLKDRPPIELLATMGIKVLDHGEYPVQNNQAYAHTWYRYTVIGCRCEEYDKHDIDQRNLVIDPMVIEHMKLSKKVTNSDLEGLMPVYDEMILGLNGINAPLVVSAAEVEEGWIII